MTLPASIPVGFHASVPEISAMQDAVNAILEVFQGTIAVPGNFQIDGNLLVGGQLEPGSLVVDGDAEVDGNFAVLGDMAGNNLSLSKGISVGTAAGATQTGKIYQGSGAPSNANGANGDAYFRTDTPGTANQRLYVKAAGAWAGIL